VSRVGDLVGEILEMVPDGYGSMLAVALLDSVQIGSQSLKFGQDRCEHCVGFLSHASEPFRRRRTVNKDEAFALAKRMQSDLPGVRFDRFRVHGGEYSVDAWFPDETAILASSLAEWEDELAAYQATQEFREQRPHDG
jgi:hypothetical protein